MQAFVKVHKSQSGIVSRDDHLVLTQEYYARYFTAESKFASSVLAIYLGGPI